MASTPPNSCSIFRSKCLLSYVEANVCDRTGAVRDCGAGGDNLMEKESLAFDLSVR